MSLSIGKTQLYVSNGGSVTGYIGEIKSKYEILPKINSPHSKFFPQFLPKNTFQGVSHQVSQGVAVFLISRVFNVAIRQLCIYHSLLSV